MYFVVKEISNFYFCSTPLKMEGGSINCNYIVSFTAKKEKDHRFNDKMSFCAHELKIKKQKERRFQEAQ